MGVLSNPKHERFAQHLFKGETADKAYQLAGYKENRGNACRLTQDENIVKRVEELQERAALRVEVSVASLTEDLLAMKEQLLGSSLDETGGSSHQHLNTARQCIMDVAKLNGLIVDRSENRNTNQNVSDLNDDELERIAAGGRSGTAETAQGETQPDPVH
jgi:phage terminase small subunit